MLTDMTVRQAKAIGKPYTMATPNSRRTGRHAKP